MVTIKQAVANAVQFAESVLEPQPLRGGLRLEEVESGRADGRLVWLITLSMELPSLMGMINVLTGPPGSREYKVFTVDKETGQVLSMKIRQLAAS